MCHFGTLFPQNHVKYFKEMSPSNVKIFTVGFRFLKPNRHRIASPSSFRDRYELHLESPVSKLAPHSESEIRTKIIIKNRDC